TPAADLRPVKPANEYGHAGPRPRVAFFVGSPGLAQQSRLPTASCSSREHENRGVEEVPRTKKSGAAPTQKRSLPTNGKTPSAQKTCGPALSHIARGLRSLAVPVSELAQMVGNPRSHPAENLEAIKAALQEYGQVETILVNRRKRPWEVIH